MSDETLELVSGTLDMLVLKALFWGPRHGYEIMRWIRDSSEEDFRIEEGALYPALHRMRARDWVRADWGRSANNRRAKFYELTAAGREALDAERAQWARYVAAVGQVLASEQEA